MICYNVLEIYIRVQAENLMFSQVLYLHSWLICYLHSYVNTEAIKLFLYIVHFYYKSPIRHCILDNTAFSVFISILLNYRLDSLMMCQDASYMFKIFDP